MEILHRSPWITLERDDARRLVIYRRTALAFASNEEMASALEALRGVVADLPLEEWCLLVDTRLAPLRNDESFEAAMRPFRQAFTGRFARTATLVKTAIGKLQIARLSREEHREAHAFVDETEALAYLAGVPRDTQRKSSRG